MFVSDIRNLDKISELDENIKKAIIMLSGIDEDIKIGRYEIEGNKIFFMVSEYETRFDNLKMEAHREYIDIQYILQGEEYVYVADIENLEVNIPYTNDIIFYNVPQKYTRIKLKIGDYVVLYPQDAHCPCVACENPSKVKKVVVKVSV